MLINSRFVIVDDKEHHLSGIKKSLDFLRLDCHSKLYTDETVAEWEKLPGTRILFLDQNLTTGATFGANNKVAFTALEDVIQKLICPESGPYGLVLWAEQPEVDELKEHLFGRLTGEDAKHLPVFFTALRKGDYIDTSNGAVLDPEKLRTDILTKVSESPQLRALLTWEADVAAAADAVLRSIIDLVPIEHRASDQFGSELGKVLFKLSQAGAGKNRATETPRESINRVLVPILSDRIAEHDPDSGDTFDWKTSLEDPKAPPTVKVQASVNSAIHLSFARTARSAPIEPTELGAVIEFPFEISDAVLKEKWGVTEAQLRDDIFQVSEAEWEDCELRLVQVGASCDNAQPNPGPLLYLLAVEWPFASPDGTKTETKKRLHKKRDPKSGMEWESPVLKFSADKNAGKVSVFRSLSISVPKPSTKGWKVSYRFREELISELTQEYARYISRPGIVTLPS
ncbi:hypothetical protein [Planktotalea sp.]|uniref:hypothetical protein n=1 Tax=Planktotalea sp. TaxID=2029877 RepID=UPI003299E6B6